MSQDEVSSQPDVLASQPIKRITRDGTEYTLLGTAHVSRASAEAVQALLEREEFDAVAIELCSHRLAAMRDPDAVAKMDLFAVLKEGRAPVVAAGLALGAFQRRLAEQFGIEPGAEMRAAADGAPERALPLWLVDRDVGLTLRRSRAAVGFWERAKLTGGMIASLIDDSEVSESEIEKLKQGDILASTFTEFAKSSPPLYEALIAERDRYMAARLRDEARELGSKRVLVVVGAGHLEGMVRELESSAVAPAETIAKVTVEPPPSKVAKIVGWAVMAFVLFGFAWAFFMGRTVGLDVVAIWVLYTGVLGALGALAAGAHPLGILAGAIASPITPFHPALSSGMVSGAVELWAYKPRVADFQALRDDLLHLKGWWRNRVARIFLIFVLTNLGTVIGVWAAGIRIAGRLAG
jgi:pheromone shutdown-related protein TraB